MKALLILIALGAVCLLWLDDKSKRAALDQAEAQIESQADEAAKERQAAAQAIANMTRQLQALAAERDQLRVQASRAAGNVNNPGPAPTAPPVPAWFQQRQNAPSSLDLPPQRAR